MKGIIKTIIIICLLAVSIAEGKVTDPTASANYVQALETANTFLSAWASRNADTGIKIISQKLISKLKKENKEVWLRNYMVGLSNPHHSSFEIGKGRILNSNRVVFPVTLYEYYTGEPKAFQYNSKIEIIKEGSSWRVSVLPITSDNEE